MSSSPNAGGLTLRALLRGHRGRLSLLSASSLAGGLVEAAFLVLITRTAFAVADGSSSVKLTGSTEIADQTAILLSLALVVIRVILSLVSVSQSASVSTDVTAELRKNLATAFLRSSWSAKHGERSGKLQELMANFAQRGAELIQSITAGITAGFNLLAMLAVAIAVSPWASIAALLVLGVLGLTLRPFRSAVRRQAARASTASMDFSTTVSETSDTGLEMHVFGVEQAVEEQLHKVIDSNEAAHRRLMLLRGLVPALYSGIAFAAALGALALTLGLEDADLSSIGPVMLVILRSLTYGQGLQTAMTSVNAARPFLEVLGAELKRYEGTRPTDRGAPIGEIGRLEAESLSFDYERGTPVLRSINFVIEPREAVGIVGPSGSGKSTLVQLLLRLRPPTGGVIRSEGRGIDELSATEWTRKITFVPQQAHLITGTIADNIRFFRDDVTQAQIEEASRLANLHDDVVGFEDGYGRQVGERGSHLSGGQQQRLIIARALVENPDVLILDEPTSALDVRSEHLVRESLNRLRDRMTVIIIAHRLSTLQMCDRIMVIQDGELRGFDSRARLEESSEFFREAVRLSGLR